jgi:hypothetical protein
VNRCLRVRHRMLQSPVVRYEHRESGRRVTVVATVHVGPAAYYQRLRTMINEMESAGAVVCYESPGPATKPETAARGGDRAEAQAAGRYLGWVDQSAALGGSPTWRNTDMTSDELARRAGPQHLQTWQRAGEDFTGLTQDQQEAFAGGASALLLRLAQLPWFDHFQRVVARRAGDAQRVIEVETRDRTSHVLASLPAESDAVLPWGAGHLPGLAAGLRTAGYRRRDTSWVTVGRLPAIWPSVKALWAGIRAIRASPGAPGDSSAPPSSPDRAT